MSELSEAEKRKILRERRQKKFGNGGATSRLNKITGQADSHLATESPLDTSRTSSVEAQTSKTFDEPIEEIKHKPVSSTTEPNFSNQQNAQIEMLKQLANNQSEGSSTPDLFSLLQSMSQGAGNSSDFPMGDLTPGEHAPLPPQADISPVDEALLKYHDYLVNRLKAWTILIKWVFFLLPYTYLVTRLDKISLVDFPSWVSILCNPSNFFMIFTSFEMIATSVYYQRLQSIERAHKVNTLDTSSKIVKLVSMVPEGIVPIPNLKGKVVLALQYWDVLTMFIADICFVLIALGIMSYF